MQNRKVFLVSVVILLTFALSVFAAAPANVILLFGNSVTDHNGPACDAMVIAPGADPTNGYGFRNCIFRGCSFQRVTLMFSAEEYHSSAKEIGWFLWTSILPDQKSEKTPLLADETEAKNAASK